MNTNQRENKGDGMMAEDRNTVKIIVGGDHVAVATNRPDWKALKVLKVNKRFRDNLVAYLRENGHKVEARSAANLPWLPEDVVVKPEKLDLKEVKDEESLRRFLALLKSEDAYLRTKRRHREAFDFHPYINPKKVRYLLDDGVSVGTCCYENLYKVLEVVRPLK